MVVKFSLMVFIFMVLIVIKNLVGIGGNVVSFILVFEFFFIVGRSIIRFGNILVRIKMG